jgi:uncharacterized protein YcfJ
MLTVVDLHQEHELSASAMGKVAGGNVISQIVQNALQQCCSGSGSALSGLAGESVDDEHKDWIEIF